MTHGRLRGMTHHFPILFISHQPFLLDDPNTSPIWLMLDHWKFLFPDQNTSQNQPTPDHQLNGKNRHLIELVDAQPSSHQ